MAKYIEVIPGIYVSSFGKLTADVEEPNCGRCQNCMHEDKCMKCGSEYGWANYEREFLYTDSRDRPIYYNERGEQIPFQEADEAIIKYHTQR